MICNDPNFYLFNLRSLLYLRMQNYIKWALNINATLTLVFYYLVKQKNKYRGKKGKEQC